MKHAYKFLLLLYPRGYRDEFAEEMTGVFEQLCSDHRAQGWTCCVRFAFGEVAGLIAGAAGARLAAKPSCEAPVAAASSGGLPREVIEAQQRIDMTIAGMVQAIANHQFERARILSDEERQARTNLRMLREKYGITD